MQYFGEAFDASRCKKTCDNCQNEAATVTHDLTPLAQNTIRYNVFWSLCVLLSSFPPSLSPSLPPPLLLLDPSRCKKTCDICQSE